MRAAAGIVMLFVAIQNRAANLNSMFFAELARKTIMSELDLERNFTEFCTRPKLDKNCLNPIKTNLV